MCWVKTGHPLNFYWISTSNDSVLVCFIEFLYPDHKIHLIFTKKLNFNPYSKFPSNFNKQLGVSTVAERL